VSRASLSVIVTLATLTLAVATGGEARAQYDRVREATGPGNGTGQGSQDEKDPLRGSVFAFDQSITTQTARLGLETPQSYVPYYGWWLTLRPRWWFTDELRVQARLDYYKEFTNAETTTYRNEDVFGDVWTDLVYQRTLAPAGRWSNTKYAIGLRAQWPTSKVSQAAGAYVIAGVNAGVLQRFTIHGDGAPFLDSARIGLGLTYWHPFTSATTPTDYGTFAYTRQNLDEHSFVSDQVTGQTLANHALWTTLELGLQATPKLGLSLFTIFVNQWHYTPPSLSPTITTGPVNVPHANDQQFTQLAWLLFAADYELFDELSVGAGYYNLANVIASDGTVRTVFGGGEDNLLWSPDARIFVDVTLNLDKLYEDANRKRASPRGQTAAAARAARSAQIANELR
jgi:hypothetical protein